MNIAMLGMNDIDNQFSTLGAINTFGAESTNYAMQKMSWYQFHA